MGKLILHKDGAYNLYSTIADGACYESALTLDQLKEVIKDAYGEPGMFALEARLDRAHATGCSHISETLKECIALNNSGPHGTRLSYNDFVARFLTFPKEESNG